ncbi:MAG: helix-turn-helix transcriptional regulator [Clostridia bacterium]|nr:helix-turn-helix transcriptional regulator [Clostridia bacterium]
MGRKSTRENKSIYQITRESLGLTREKAGELIPGFSPERIEKIENERVQIRPDDVKLMAEYYKAPGLCNYYCSEECPIGKGRTPRVESRELVQIAVETINGINRLNRVKDRLLEIAEDGTISPDEYEDFAEIRETLEKLQVSVSTLQLWLEQKMAEGEIREEAFE